MEDFVAKVQSFMPDSEKDPLEETPIEAPSYANKVFKLPIEYLESNVHDLNPIVASDLELTKALDESIPSIYDCTFCSDSSFALQVIPMYQKKFTTNVEFLKDTQMVIENMDDFYETEKYTVCCDKIQSHWTTVKHDPKFMETYGYLDWDMLKEYNKNSIVLQSLTLANMLSPIMSFLLPILFMLFPFVILKIQGVPITLSMYFKILKEIAKNHFIGQAISIFESYSLQKLIYLLAMLGLYGFQMYQNTVQCLRFYRNIQKMNEELCEWKQFCSHSKKQMASFYEKNKKMATYKPFCKELLTHMDILEDMGDMLYPICPFSCSIGKTTEIGYMLKCYYELHTNLQYENTLLFSMGFEGYLRLMKGVFNQLDKGMLHKAEFIVSDDMTIIETDVSGENVKVVPQCSIAQQFYPPHKDESMCVKNDVTLDTYGVITGPNASGKTTYLKTTAINVILTQQLGVGFYDQCTMQPYTHIHSYLNIPDTSGRDSLFQAESRRCKEILETIKTSDERHFCIFDELYSGTNPKEATKAAYAFLEYLRQYRHVDLFLTTHYVSICDSWKEDDTKRPIENYRMKVEQKKGKNVPTYCIEKGISRIEGAVGILEDMEYPEEMINMIMEDTTITV